MQYRPPNQIRRHSDGSIDFEFYAAVSRRERAIMVKKQFRGIAKWMGRTASGLRGQRL
jgi:hypothetical protein